MSVLGNAIATFAANAQKIYNIVHGGPTETVATDGGTVPTFAKLLRDAQSDLSLQTPVAYTAGIVIDSTLETVVYNDVVYSAKESAIPFTTTNWATDEAKLRVATLSADDTAIVKALPTAEGAEQVAHTFPYAPAFLKLLSDLLNGSEVTLHGFMSQVQINEAMAFTGTSDLTSALQDCLDENAKALKIPFGKYRFDGTALRTNGGVFHLRGDGMGATLIDKHGDSDWLQLHNASNGGAISVKGMTISPKTDMSVGAAISVIDTGVIPSATFEDVFIGAPSGGEFKYGIKLVDCIEAVFRSVRGYGVNQAKYIPFYIASSIGNSTAHKLFGCSVYNALYALDILNVTSPGVEGVQLYGCDLVGIHTGVRARNSFGPTYFPPQILMSGGHINAARFCLDIETFGQVTVTGGALLYNSGATAGDAFIRLFQCGDISITGNQFITLGAGTAQGIAMATSAEPINGGLIGNNKFNISPAANCILIDASKIINHLAILDNQRISGAKLVEIVGGAKSNSLVIRGNFPLDDDDVFQSLAVSVSNPTLAGLRAKVILLSAAAPLTISQFFSRSNDDEVTLKCDANITLQHNGTNPDGFLLKGGTNFTFTSGSMIHLKKLNGGYWTEVGRSV